MIKSIARYFCQPLFYEIKPKDRYSTYLVYISIVAFCILFLHAFIEAPLTFFELVVHVFFIIIPSICFCIITELIGRLFAKSQAWKCSIDVWQLWLFGSILSVLIHSLSCYLEDTIPIPILQRIAQKHIASGHDAFTFIQAALLVIIIFAALTEFLLRRRPTLNNESSLENNESAIADSLPAEGSAVAEQDKMLDIKIDGELKQISLSSTAYIEADENYCHLWQLENEDTGTPTRYTVRSTLKELHVRLPEASFMQTHRSYLINPHYAKKIRKINDKFHVLMVNDIAVPVSRSRIKLVMEHYASFNPEYNNCISAKVSNDRGALSKYT